MRQAVGEREKAGQARRRDRLGATGIGSARPTHETRSISGDTPNNNRCVICVARRQVVIQLGTCQWPAPLAIASERASRKQGTVPVSRDMRLSHQQGGGVVATSPTVRQRELGKRLRELRLEHGLTVEEVADKLLCSPTKVSRLETGTRRPSLRDVRDLSGIYGVDEVSSAALMDLARGAREQVWWTQYLDLNLDPYLGLEQDAIAITSFTTFYVPALLQTEAYTKAIISSIAPKMDPDILRQRVEVRMRRQERLEGDKRPRYRVLLDEAVLHRAIGGREIMAAQLTKVLEAEKKGKVTFQVIPFEHGAHVAQDSNFIFFEFEQGSERSSSLSPVVFVEGLTGNQYLEKQVDIDRYREAIEYLRDSALTPRDSVQRVTEMRNTYAS
jgi:transcriptional regulator with XRE-family HTH domain